MQKIYKMRTSQGATTLRLQPKISIIHSSNNPEALAAAVWGGRRVVGLLGVKSGGEVGGGAVGVFLNNEADNERKTQLLIGIKPG